jgi:hypothetical protein
LSDCYVITNPAYFHPVKAWHPFSFRVIIHDSRRLTETVRLTLAEDSACGFGRPWGARDITVACEPTVHQIGDRVKLVHTCDVTIWPRRNGLPRVRMTSPDEAFQPTTNNLAEVEVSIPARLESASRSANLMHDSRWKNILRKAIHAFIPVMAGVAGILLLLWWSTNRTPTRRTNQVSVTDTSRQTQPDPTQSTAQPISVATIQTPTNCDFAHVDRPMIGEKYLLTCSQGTFLGRGEYQTDFSFRFTEFEKSPAPD